MNARLMTPADLVEVTGKKRYAKQAEWFKEQFGIAVVRRGNRSIVMTWATYEALAAKKAGIASSGAPAKKDVDICYD